MRMRTMLSEPQAMRVQENHTHERTDSHSDRRAACRMECLRRLDRVSRKRRCTLKSATESLQIRPYRDAPESRPVRSNVHSTLTLSFHIAKTMSKRK